MNIAKKYGFSLSLTTLISVLLIFSFLALTRHQIERLTADTMLYFSIAQKYADGDFSNGINGYWGPLLAWLLVPFLHLGISHIRAINTLDLALGALSIIGVWWLSFRFEITEMMRSIILILLLPIVLKFSVVQPMDLLLVCILVYYLAIIFNSDYPKRTSGGIFSGILGALAYFSKAYAFPFFVVHFLSMNVLHYMKAAVGSDRKKIMRNALVGFILFFVLSGAWVMALNHKYGYYTFSTMTKTNFNAPGPEDMGKGLEFGVPVFYEGFFDPPNKTAFVVWEDPSYLKGRPWRPWDSMVHFKHFLRLVLKNISDGLVMYESFSVLSVAIIIAYLLLLTAQPAKELLSKSVLLFPLVTMILYSGGYAIFHVEERYLWLVNVLLLLMGGYVLTVLFREDFFNSRLRRGILTVFFIVSFTFTPTKYLIQIGRGGMDSDMYYVGSDLKKYNIEGNIASNREYVPVHDAWHKTFRLAYWLNSRYYGQAKENISDIELENEFNKHDIDYYFFWGTQADTPQFLNQYRELTKDEIPGLKIYFLKEKNNLNLHF